MYCDSQNTIHLTKAKSYVRIHFILDGVVQGDVSVEKIVSYNNSTNMMLKYLISVKFKYCVSLIDIANILILCQVSGSEMT